MAVQLLCAADYHLGRRTRRLPEGIEPSACSPAAALQRLVDLALQRRPDAVLLAGDIVDQDNAFFEAFGPLEAAVRRLVDAGIPVLAVAGNHDHQVLVRLAERIPEFGLLGRGGHWEERTVEADGEVRARILGWSFPRTHVRDNPLAAWPRPEPGPPVVGLLHCDVDVGDSRYAPVPRADLQSTAAAAWVLGHVHAPRVLHAADPLLLYCGSPQGLDPSETGPHGAWWLRIDDAGRVDVERVTLAGLRWEAIEVPLDRVDDQPRFEAAVLEALRGLRDGLDGAAAHGPLPLGCRLTLSGRTPAHDRIAAWCEELGELRLPADGDAGELFIDKVIDEAAPALDLEQLARASDPPGLLARRLRVLTSGEPRSELARLLREGRERLEGRAGLGTYVGLGDPRRLEDRDVRDWLWRAGLRLLEALLAQAQGEARP